MIRRRRFHAALAAAVGTVALPVSVPLRAQGAVKIEGFTFPGEIVVAGTKLLLNGVGVRQVAWLKGYAAGLYLTQKATTPLDAIAVPGPKRVSMHMLIDGPSDEFAKAFVRGANRNAAPDKRESMQERIQLFDAIVRRIGAIRKGDLIEVEWRPGEGTMALVNGKQREQAVPGEDLFVALLKIYIGDRPTDTKMKEGLLGGPVR